MSINDISWLPFCMQEPLVIYYCNCIKFQTDSKHEDGN